MLFILYLSLRVRRQEIYIISKCFPFYILRLGIAQEIIFHISKLLILYFKAWSRRPQLPQEIELTQLGTTQLIFQDGKNQNLGYLNAVPPDDER